MHHSSLKSIFYTLYRKQLGNRTITIMNHMGPPATITQRINVTSSGQCEELTWSQLEVHKIRPNGQCAKSPHGGASQKKGCTLRRQIQCLPTYRNTYLHIQITSSHLRMYLTMYRIRSVYYFFYTNIVSEETDTTFSSKLLNIYMYVCQIWIKKTFSICS